MPSNYKVLLFFLLGTACVSNMKDLPGENHNDIKWTTNPLITDLNGIIDFENLQHHHLKPAAEFAIYKADSIRGDIIKVPLKDRNFANTMLPLDDLYNELHKMWNPISLLGAVHPDKEMRDEADSVSLLLQNYFIDLASDSLLFLAVKKIVQSEEAKTLSVSQKRFLESEFRDFIHAGYGLPDAKRKRLKEIRNELFELYLQFDNNIAAHSDTLFIPSEYTGGLPDDYIQERLTSGNMVAVDLTYPSFYPFMEYADSDSLRKVLRIKFLNRGMPGNDLLLKNIIQLRYELAEILGYNSYAEYALIESMAGTPERVWEFEENLISLAGDKAAFDTDIFKSIKSKITGKKQLIINDWEKYYYETRQLELHHNLDPEEIKVFFQSENVIQGFFHISSILFDVEFKNIVNPSVWHPDVTMYELWDNKTDRLLGRFYLDLFPRENKYQHTAEFSIVSGKKVEDAYQIPVAALVCNFPKPTKHTPSLLLHDDVETFFHEFGHLIHELFTTVELSSQSGTSVAMDFVEAPSQIFENWVWHQESLNLFAKHYLTGETIPDTLLTKMIAAKNVQSGNDLLQQIFYGLIDLTLYDKYVFDAGKSPMDIAIHLQNEITHYPYIEGTNILASFDHLLGYGASYYGYLWSEVYAADMFSVFEEKGILDPQTGNRFRKTILERGGMVDPMVMVRDYLGREPNNAAFLKNQGFSFKNQ
mgnify:CR=1 FL=1